MRHWSLATTPIEKSTCCKASGQATVKLSFRAVGHEEEEDEDDGDLESDPRAAKRYDAA